MFVLLYLFVLLLVIWLLVPILLESASFKPLHQHHSS